MWGGGKVSKEEDRDGSSPNTQYQANSKKSITYNYIERSGRANAFNEGKKRKVGSGRSWNDE